MPEHLFPLNTYQNEMSRDAHDPEAEPAGGKYGGLPLLGEVGSPLESQWPESCVGELVVNTKVGR